MDDDSRRPHDLTLPAEMAEPAPRPLESDVVAEAGFSDGSMGRTGPGRIREGWIPGPPWNRFTILQGLQVAS